MKRILIVMMLALIISCEPTIKVTGSWKNPKSGSKAYSSILVASLTNSNVAKVTVEKAMAEALAKYDVRVIKSMDEFSPNFTKDNFDKEKMISTVRDKGIDAILTVSIINTKTETHYVPGTSGIYAYQPYPRFDYYGNFWGYYNYWYPFFYNPGYYTQDQIYFLETNLYDVTSDELIWSAQSQTYNPNDLDPFSKKFAETIVERLKQDGILKVSNKMVKM